ncbi:MAG: CsbD family protein [Alphaproteobacteria bacterium]|nr:MAG: CsbD family protein [Alphaproteobacteria bacterium]
MNTDILEGKWKQFKGEIQNQWGKLTDDDLARIDGHREKFLGSLEENYGMARDDAERALMEFERIHQL